MSMAEIIGHTVDSRTNKPSDALVTSDRYVGLELELEFCAVVSAFGLHPGNFWEVTTDDSLRNAGLEFRSKLPLKGQDLVDSIQGMDKFVQMCRKQDRTSCDPNERTSLHVHVDVRDLEWDTVKLLIGLYIFVERVLYHYAGHKRHLSVYSAPTYKVYESVSDLFTTLTNSNPSVLRDRLRGQSRYAGLNLQAIYKYGSLEFRQHGGTVNGARMLEWVNILLQLFDFTIKSKDSLETIYKTITKHGVVPFAQMLLGNYVHIMQYPEAEYHLRQGLLTLEATRQIPKNKEYVTKLQKHFSPKAKGGSPEIQNSADTDPALYINERGEAIITDILTAEALDWCLLTHGHYTRETFRPERPAADRDRRLMELRAVWEYHVINRAAATTSSRATRNLTYTQGPGSRPGGTTVSGAWRFSDDIPDTTNGR